MAVFAYGRAGASEQPILHQRDEIERSGYKVDHWYTEEEGSGIAPVSRRPQFEKMLHQIPDGATLVVSKLDHLGCDAQDVDTTIRLLAARRVEVFVLQLGDMDLNSAAGKPMLVMLAAIAEMERAQSGRANKNAQGPQPSRSAKTTSEQRTEIITEYSRGLSVSELARRYRLSRPAIMAIVKPKRRLETEPLPMGWGD